MRNIVICCDGTGNEISQNISNVLKLDRCVRKTEKTQPRQLVRYHPASARWRGRTRGTSCGRISTPSWGLPPAMGWMTPCSRPTNSWSTITRDGDQIYPFGFSRGAYTVRVLAGLISKAGLVSPQQVNLAGSGLSAYKQFSSDVAPKFGLDLHALTDAGDEDGPLAATPFDNAAQFSRITSARWPTIRFVGVWDTVASVLVPRPDRFYWPSLEDSRSPCRTRA